jgi:hypothetical protein
MVTSDHEKTTQYIVFVDPSSSTFSCILATPFHSLLYKCGHRVGFDLFNRPYGLLPEYKMATSNPIARRVDSLEIDTENKFQGISTNVEKTDSGSDNEQIKSAPPEQHMTKAIWLACIALSLSYTTAFQQNACTAAIVKHIDTELGM